AQVAQLQLADAVEVGAGVHGGDAAADAGLALALGDDALGGGLARLLVVAALASAGAGQDLVGHPVEADGDQHAEIRVGRQFGGAVGGDVAVVDQVALGGGVVLDHAEGDVVVGQHQAVGGDERTGAATGAHHGVERGGGEV